MVRRLIECLVFSMLFLSAAARASDGGWDKAKAAYDAGDFSVAREEYEALVREGRGGSALYFNLGNAYFRLGNAGRARLWYERALAVAPRDEDIRFNRNLVRTRAGLTEGEASPLIPWAPALAWLGMGLNFVFFGVLSWRLRGGRGEATWWAAWVTGLAFLATAAFAAAALNQAREPWAIVTADRAEARSAPSEEAPVGFTAPEGQKVITLRTLNDWSEIGLPSKGLKGWVPSDTVENI